MSLFDPQYRKQSRAARVGMALFRLSQAIKKMSQSGGHTHGLSPVQVQTLLFIRYTRADVATVGNLANAIGATHATAVGILNGLAAKGLIVKQPSTEDRRVTLLQLTEKGRKVAEQVDDWGKSLEEALQHIPDEMLAGFETVLGAVLNTLRQRGLLVIAEPCLGCVHFRPNLREGHSEPHYCDAIQKYLTHAASLQECPEHTPKRDVAEAGRGESV